MGSKILAINPGSTSTKVALYDDEHPLLELTLRHSAEEIARFDDIISQLDWRREIILSALREQHFDIRELAVVIGRGGLVKPIPAGVYEVNDAMRHDLRHASREHASMCSRNSVPPVTSKMRRSSPMLSSSTARSAPAPGLRRLPCVRSYTASMCS